MQLSQRIDDLLTSYATEELHARGKVIDDMLDLRLDADAVVASLIDTVLARVPGKNLVERRWLEEALASLRHVAETAVPEVAAP